MSLLHLGKRLINLWLYLLSLGEGSRQHPQHPLALEVRTVPRPHTRYACANKKRVNWPLWCQMVFQPPHQQYLWNKPKLAQLYLHSITFLFMLSYVHVFYDVRSRKAAMVSIQALSYRLCHQQQTPFHPDRCCGKTQRRTLSHQNP